MLNILIKVVSMGPSAFAKQYISPAVLKMGVTTLFRVDKYFLRVGKIFYFFILP
jgi:hypothetical protein